MTGPGKTAEPTNGRPALVDTHCHLDAERFAGEPTEALLARAAEVGVTRVVTIGTDVATSRAAVELARSHDGVWATVGVDPHDAAGCGEAEVAALADLARAPEVVAVGEIGLDYYWDRAPREVQERVFRAQLGLARELGLPVVIHSREADEDTAAVLIEWSADHPRAGAPLGVMHCYAGDLALAERLVAAGFLISLAGNVTYPSARRTQEVAAGLPGEAIVLETDAPYLAPRPFRGQRNEPAHVAATAAFVAELRGTTVAELAQATSANAARLFGWVAT